MSDTIVALATPAGRSGIGVVRLSGPSACEYASELAAESVETFAPRTARLSQLRLSDGEVIDEAIITCFRSPRSFTGEDVVEISCHGSPVVLRQVIDACLKMGARLAEAGEFTLRALANGRMDLAEAEAIRDLIDAQTAAAARQAVRQLRGEFSLRLRPIKDELLDVIVILESALEFVEDDLPEIQAASVRSRSAQIAASIDEIAATFQAGHLIREGLSVALVGRPNVGKSSLFNALVGSDRAIVTDIAGTTRDQIHANFTIGDIPISLIDTAGLRETTDTVESIGVERSRRTMADADLVVLIVDISQPATPEDIAIFESISQVRHLVIANKIDIVDEGKLSKMLARLRESIGNSAPVEPLSAKTGKGLDSFKSAILAPFASSGTAAAGFLVTDARHFDLLTRASADIRHSLSLLDEGTSEEIVLIGLHNALRYLGQITGETTTEDMLTRIFSTFCIGK